MVYNIDYVGYQSWSICPNNCKLVAQIKEDQYTAFTIEVLEFKDNKGLTVCSYPTFSMQFFLLSPQT